MRPQGDANSSPSLLWFLMRESALDYVWVPLPQLLGDLVKNPPVPGMRQPRRVQNCLDRPHVEP